MQEGVYICVFPILFVYFLFFILSEVLMNKDVYISRMWGRRNSMTDWAHFLVDSMHHVITT